jgi:hypothetical protein
MRQDATEDESLHRPNTGCTHASNMHTPHRMGSTFVTPSCCTADGVHNIQPANRAISTLLFWQDAEKYRQWRSRLAQRLTARHRVRFTSSLTAALLATFFRILHGCSAFTHTWIFVTATEVTISSSATCWSPFAQG